MKDTDCKIEKGFRGPRGFKGDKGDPGLPGNTIQGPTGPSGQNGLNGLDGVDGSSAYQIWLAEGNIGSEQDFLDTLVGPIGVTATVSVGSTTTGSPGSSAAATLDGASTPTNSIFNFVIPAGDQGAQGNQGVQGKIGVPGSNSLYYKVGDMTLGGHVKVDAVAMDAVTQIEISKTSLNGYGGTVHATNNAYNWLNSITTGMRIQLQDPNDNAVFGIYDVITKTIGSTKFIYSVAPVVANGNFSASNSDMIISYNSIGSVGGVASLFPTGFMVPYPAKNGVNVPTGFLLADGSTKLILDYPDLYNILGTAWGGDGVTTFMVPNMVNNIVMGSGSTVANGAYAGARNITISDNNIPEHSHGFSGTTDGDRANLVTASTDGTTGSASPAGSRTGDYLRIKVGADNDLSGSDTQQQVDHEHTFSGTTDLDGGVVSPTALDILNPVAGMRYIIKT